MIRPTILDGGMGRELKRMGAPFRQPEWSALALIEAPEYVARAHRAFIEAGADVITTNSYALVPFHIGEARFAAEGQALAECAGRMAAYAAREAGGHVSVAGSLPPLFGSYRPDLFDPERAQALLKPLVDGLAPYVDKWLGETLSSIREAEAIAAAIFPPVHAEFWLSFTLDDEAPDTAVPRLRSGEPVAEAMRAADRLRASTVLFNCSQPEVMAAAVEAAGAARERRGPMPLIGVYANAFPPQRSDAAANETLHDIRPDLTPERYAEFARDWVARGASVIGGCCGIGPEHIRTLSAIGERREFRYPQASVTQAGDDLFEAVVTMVPSGEAVWRTDGPIPSEDLLRQLEEKGIHRRDALDFLSAARRAAEHGAMARELEPWVQSASVVDLLHALEDAALEADEARVSGSDSTAFRTRLAELQAHVEVDFNDEELKRHGRAMNARYEAERRAHAKIDLFYEELRRRRAEAALLPLLAHDHPGIRLAAAVLGLRFDPDPAFPVLGRMMRQYKTVEERHRARPAQDALFFWRRGSSRSW